MNVAADRQGAGSAPAVEHLTFALGQEHYALEVSRVREVVAFPGVTRIPRTPEYLRGIINLRGGVVPVVDLRVKLSMSAAERGVDTCVIVTELCLADGPAVVGLLADAVEEVLRLEAPKPPPRMGASIDTELLKAVGRRAGQLVIVLNLERIFSAGAAADLQEGPPSSAGESLP